MQNQVELLQRLASSVKDITEILAEQLKDESIPLKDRWNLYLNIEQFMEPDSWVSRFTKLNGKEYVWYDDFYMDRYQTRKYSELVDSLFESQAHDRHYDVEKGGWPEGYTCEGENADTEFNYPEVVHFIEQVLKSGKSGCTYDW